MVTMGEASVKVLSFKLLVDTLKFQKWHVYTPRRVTAQAYVFELFFLFELFVLIADYLKSLEYVTYKTRYFFAMWITKNRNQPSFELENLQGTHASHANVLWAQTVPRGGGDQARWGAIVRR